MPAVEKYCRHTAITLTTVDDSHIPLETMLHLDATQPQRCQQVRARLHEGLDRTEREVIIGTSMETNSRIIANQERYNFLRKAGPQSFQCDVAALDAITRENN